MDLLSLHVDFLVIQLMNQLLYDSCTPEPGWSYASFETNMIGDYKAIVDKCINVFQPGQFMVTF